MSFSRTLSANRIDMFVLEAGHGPLVAPRQCGREMALAARPRPAPTAAEGSTAWRCHTSGTPGESTGDRISERP